MNTTILYPIALIKVAERLRDATTNEVREHIDRLKDSIEHFGGHPRGLLQPIVIDDNDTILDGFCRYTACKELGWETIPIYRRSSLTNLEYEEVELEANIRRLGFTWQEIVQQVCKIHRNHIRQAASNGTKWT